MRRYEQDAGRWVDVGKPTAANVTLATPASVSPWEPLHRWAATMAVVTPAAVAAGLDAYGAGLPENRRQQFNGLRQRMPFSGITHADVCRYCLRLQNASRAAMGRPAYAYHVAAERWGWPAMPLSRPSAVRLDTFGRCAVINLDRRPERLDRFADNVASVGWPFAPVIRSAGVDGWAIRDRDIPAGWNAGKGGYGCSLSHRAVLRQAAADGVGSVLVMEDDALFGPTFCEDAARFIAAVEAHDPTWEMLMLGGQPLHGCQPVPLGNGVARSVGTNRFHCYGVRGPLIVDLLARLESSSGHCDIDPWDLLRGRRVYEPDPYYIVCQNTVWSDIASRDEGVRCWPKAPVDVRSVLLLAPRGVMEELARSGWHFGYNRDPATGIDVWLQGLRDDVDGIRAFVEGIKGEAAASLKVPALWQPNLSVETMRAAMPGRWVEVKAGTTEEARAKLAVEAVGLDHG